MQSAVSTPTAPITMPTCPRCGQNTAVSQVPYLVEAGLSTTPAKSTIPLQWRGTTYYAPMQAGDNTMARLALRLFPTPRMRNPPIPEVQMPQRGQIPRESLIRWGLFLLVANVIGFIQMGSNWFGVLAVGSLVGLGLLLRVQRSNLFYSMFEGSGASPLVEDSRVTQAFKAAEPGTPQYAAAMAAAEARQARAGKRWDWACYCATDDCVFIPGEPATARPEQMESLLYPV